MTILGIDPGKKGGIALLAGTALVELHPYTGSALHSMLCRHTPDRVFVE